MPELPEVESLRRILARSAVGRTIERARVTEPRLRRTVAQDFAAGVEGRRILRLGRRAKYLIIELSDGAAMIVHLGMSGSLTHRGKDFDDAEFAARHDHVEFALDDLTRLVYNDPRRFGLIRLVSRDGTGRGARACGARPRAARRCLQCGVPGAARARAARRDQELHHGSADSRRNRQHLRLRDFVPRRECGRRAAPPKSRARRSSESWPRPRRFCARRSAAAAPLFAAIATPRDSRDDSQTRLMVYGREGEPCRVCKSADPQRHGRPARELFLPPVPALTSASAARRRRFCCVRR